MELIFVTGCWGKACPTTKLKDLEVLSDFPNEPNIKALSVLGADIQPVTKVVATEPKFVTGC